MSKRIFSLLLCAVMLVSCFVSCSDKSDDENDLGAYITMYLTDDIYDFDPANAYYNTDTLNVVSLMYDTLFTLDADGDVEESLVDTYEFGIDKRTGENYMEIVLNETYWSNGTRLSADDVAFAWRRLLTSTNSYAAASLLYDIKNARAVKEGDVSIDNVGIEALSIDRLKITFEGPVDEDQFILNLTSVATAPLLESYVSKNDDWAKKPSTMVTSGPFKLGKIFYETIKNAAGTDKKEDDPYAYGKGGVLIDNPEKKSLAEVTYFYLERNVYYYRDIERDAIDEIVTPYRLLVDCTKTDEEIYNEYADGKIFFMGSIPLSLRGNAALEASKVVSNTLSTFTLYLNQYAYVKSTNGSAPLFANAAVRRALSLAIDRDAIAASVVYAQAATGLVAPGVFENGKISNADFRTIGSNLIATSANVAQAKADLAAAGINPADYSFSIKVAAYDDVNVQIARMVTKAWRELGFTVSLIELQPIVNNDYLKEIDGTPEDVCDDRIVEALKMNDYEVIAMDYTAFTANASSVLMNFATPFSGMSLNMSTYQLGKHTTGYSSVAYNNLMEAVYYIPYFASLSSTSPEYLQRAFTKKPYVDTAIGFADNAVAEISKVANAVRASTQVGALDQQKLADIDAYVTARIAKINSALNPMQIANRELIRAYETINVAFARQAEIDVAVQEAVAAQKEAVAALTAAKNAVISSKKDPTNLALEAAMTAALENMNAVFTTFIEKAVATEDIFKSVSADVDAATAWTNTSTLYDFIAAIYAENGITPTTDASQWAAQKNILLHKAEALLMEEMPVIPVIFTKNATISRAELLNLNNSFEPLYSPYNFTTSSLKNYNTYRYYSEIEKAEISIFADFPNIPWDKVGK